MSGGCFLARFSDRPCEGRLVRTHLIDKQRLKRAGADPWDERSYVLACGGYGYGNEAHHAELDDRRLILPRSALPEAVEALAAEVGLEHWLDRRYGPREVAR